MSLINRDHYPWLTNTFFERILISSDGILNARVLDFVLEEAVTKGENYGSQMIRVLVNYSLRGKNSVNQKSYIVKTTLSGGFQTIMDLLPSFAKEIAFFRDVLPQVMKYAALSDPSFKFAPLCYKINENPVYFVLEDLKSDGYRTMDRRVGLDFHATELVVKKVARYHAMGAMLLVESLSNTFDAHRIKAVNPENKEIVEIFMCGLRDCQELSRNWQGYEHLSIKLEKLNKIFIDKMQSLLETVEPDFTVVTHGDLWINNIMFKFDEDNKPIDVILVDHQLGYIGSPAHDLSFLFYTATKNDVCEIEWDRLLQIYHIELVKSLKAINYTRHIPTLNELHQEMLKRSLYAVMLSLAIVAPRHIEKLEHANLDLFAFGNEKSKLIRQELFAKPEVRERIFYLLDYYERKGFLEFE